MQKQPTPPAAGDPSRMDRLKAMFDILEGSSLDELSYEDGDIRVKLSRPGQPAPPMVVASAAPPSPAPPLVQADEPHVINSPFVGTFYRAKSPSAKPFTDAGASVRRGQTLCIVEAMKLMNEIESEIDGQISEILVENGATVQYGDPLFEICRQ